MPKWLHRAPGAGPRRVFLAMPVYGDFPPLFTYCLADSVLAIKEAGYEIEIGMLAGHCHVDDARNQLIREFLSGLCQELVFIDADIGWSAQSMLALLAHKQDIVGATYPLKQDQENYPVRLISGEIWSDSDGLIEVEGIPAGFMKLSRAAAQKLADNSDKYTEHTKDKECPLIFERKIFYGVRYSGDYSFCHKWRELGGKVYLDPEIYLEHEGPHTWCGTFGSFLRRKNGLALKGPMKAIRAQHETDKDIIDLVMDWGNIPYAAGGELVKAAISAVRQVHGDVIELGSGLTTIAMAAANPVAKVWALEHDKAWGRKTQEAADSLGLGNIHLCYAPLQGSWYTPTLKPPWHHAQMVLCDGPPRWLGDRSQLFPFMKETGCRPKVLLQDDVSACANNAELCAWANEFGYQVSIMGECKKFACLTRNGDAVSANAN